MDRLGIFQPQNLRIDFNFQHNKADILIASSLVIFVLSEVAIKNEDLDYWDIDDRLKKHRTVREFDYHVQQMLWLLKDAGGLKASISNCGSNNYHFVQYDDVETDSCMRVLHTFNPKAKYMKKYLSMNQDYDNPRFAYIQYSIDSSKTNIRKIKMVIPGIDGGTYRSYNLIHQYKIVKQYLGPIKRDEINRIMHSLKEEAKVKELPDE